MHSVFRTSFLISSGLLAGLMFLFFPGPAMARFSSGRAEFAAQCDRQRLTYCIQSVFVLPGEALHLQILERRGADYTLEARGCRTTSLKPGAWQVLPPPRPGCYPALLVHGLTGRTIKLRIFVLVPFQHLQKQHINGYRVGSYPNGNDRSAWYGQPRGFVEVTAGNQEEWVSPHFKLRQFCCKQTRDFPQYIVLRPELLSKLEGLLELLAARGCGVETLNILSGYRTPYYNQSIHNTRFSAHQWGMAADISLESPADDFNHDGCTDLQDAEWLYQAVEDWEADPSHASLVGGMGLYLQTPHHPPFVHVDVRGVRARWGAVPVRPQFACQEPPAEPAVPDSPGADMPVLP